MTAAAPLNRPQSWVQVNGEWVPKANQQTKHETLNRPTRWYHWMVSPSKLHNEAMNWVDQANRSQSFFLIKMAEQSAANACATLTGSYKTVCLGLKLAGQTAGLLPKLELAILRFITRDKSPNSYYHSFPGLSDCGETAVKIYKQFLGLYASVFGVAVIGSEYNAAVQRHYGNCTQFDGEVDDKIKKETQKYRKKIPSILKDVKTEMTLDKLIAISLANTQKSNVLHGPSQLAALSEVEKENYLVTVEAAAAEGCKLIRSINNKYSYAFDHSSGVLNVLVKDFIFDNNEVYHHKNRILTRILEKLFNSDSKRVKTLVVEREKQMKGEANNYDAKLQEFAAQISKKIQISVKPIKCHHHVESLVFKKLNNELLDSDLFSEHVKFRVQNPYEENNTSYKFKELAVRIGDEVSKAHDLNVAQIRNLRFDKLKQTDNRVQNDKIDSERLNENNPQYKTILSIRKLVADKPTSKVDSFDKQVSLKLRKALVLLQDQTEEISKGKVKANQLTTKPDTFDNPKRRRTKSFNQ